MRKFPASLFVRLVTSAILSSPALAQLPVADPTIWLRADQGVIDDGAGGVERWEDQSGNGNDFLQATATRRPTLRADGVVLGGGELIELENTQNGNSTYGGTLAIDFIVEEEIEVTHLAAFDHLRDGINGTLTVKLWSRPDNGTKRVAGDDSEGTLLEQLTFSSADPGELVESYRWRPLSSPRTLPPGSYTLSGSGYTGTDYYFSSSNAVFGPTWKGISFPPETRYGSDPSAWPTTITSLGTRYGGCANLRFHPVSSTTSSLPAVVFDGTDDGLLAPEGMDLGRPSTVFIVAEADRSEFGYILQNAGGNNQWSIRTDGYYVGGWVRQVGPTWWEPTLMAMVNGPAGTRAIQNLDELTLDGSLAGIGPGRLALGGGEGRFINAYPGRVAELVAFDRQLSEAEILAMQKYFGDRYSIFETPVATPEISPPGDIGTGDVAVTLASNTAGAEIRYTLDGSEPTATSTLYSGAIQVGRGIQVRAKGFLAGSPDSGVASQYYAAEGGPDLPPGGPVGWFRADRGVETDANGGVTEWSDLTGNGNSFLQGTAAQRPHVESFSGNGLAIRTVHGDEGSNTHNGTLGADFVVTEEVVVTELAAFDHRSDGFSAPVTVQLLVRDDAGTPATPQDDLPGAVVAEMEFSPASPGTLDGPFRTKSLASPLTLAPGSYTIMAWGYVGGDLYRNSSNGGWREGSVRFVNASRYSSSLGSWPTIIDSHPVKYNGAGNFRYQPAAGAAPETTIHFDGNDGLYAGEASYLGRPSTVIFALEYDSDGRLLQNSSASQWFIRGTDRYAGGYLSTYDLPVYRKVVAAMTQGPGDTRFYFEGQDWTETSGYSNGEPGRLTLGGANGYSSDPAIVRFSEVLTYDRVLDEGEIWQAQHYLSQRLGSEPVELPQVVIAPASNFGTGDVSVSLSHPVPGVEIRYTTDGSEPTAASTLFGGSFDVPRGTTVRARAFFPGAPPSEIVEALYGQSGAADDLPISGAGLWLRADAGLTLDSAGNVAQWSDLSGHGNDFIQTVADKRPHLMKEESLSRTSTWAIVPRTISGSAAWNGSLGEDFKVDESLEVTHLGAFDHNGDGFSGTITVELWSRNDAGTPLTPGDDTPGVMIARQTFSSAAPGELSGFSRFKALPAPMTLAPGNYTIFAYGYQGQDFYREGDYSRSGADGRFRFVGVSRYSNTPGSWPGSLDNRQLDYTGAANFRFTPLHETTPGLVAFDGENDGLLGVSGMNFARPSTLLVAFELAGNQSGYVVQNSGGNQWSIRQDGYYSQGWVLNEGFNYGQPYVAGMINASDETRAIRDGADVTLAAGLFSANPGRMALGGGEGRTFDPADVRIAEVVAFDRVLDASELQSMYAYLANRHQPDLPTAKAPEISPLSSYGSGNVIVTLTSANAGGEIRYTLDGSTPDAGSTLYAGPFSVTRGTEVRAVGLGTGLQPSIVSSAYYGDSGSHPLPVSDAAMWLKSDRGVERDASGLVHRWRDLSGNGRDVVQPDVSQSPQWLADGFGAAEKEVAPREAGRTGSTNYAGWLGTDFVVVEPIEITGLSAFDSAGDGFAGNIVVRLHSLDDAGTPDGHGDDTSTGVIATLTFTSAEPGELDGSKRRLPLPSPVLLLPGRYSIESKGWDGANSYESSENFILPQVSSVVFPGTSRYSTLATSIPGTRVSDNRYLGSAGFTFREPGASDAGQPALRFDGADDGMLGPDDFLVNRPSTVFMVFQSLQGTRGRMLQSGSGSNWLLGPHSSPQGYYAGGWVTQQTIRANTPSLVIAEQNTSDSRYYYNGQDLTQDPNPTGNLGRVALGGGEGTYFQPEHGDLVELVVYDRVLEAAERQAVGAALAGRYQLPEEPLFPVVMSPAGGLFASGQTVTITHPTAGAEIRYTMDGSDPDESSTLYTAPFLVTSDAVVKARAYAPGYAPGEITDAAFFIDGTAPLPPSRSSMLVWLSAGVGAEDDGSNRVQRWRDLSGKGNDAAQAVDGQRPLLNATIVGGAPGLVFDGTDDFLRLPEGFENFDNGFTAMFVVRPDGVGSWQRFIDLSRGANFANVFVGRQGATTNLAYDVRGTNGSGNLQAVDVIQPLGNAIFTVCQQPDGSVKIYANGSLEAEDETFPLPQNILRTLNLIGKSAWNSDAHYSGSISEVIIYNSALGDLERESFEQDLREIYGIASTSAGTVAFSPSPASLYPSGVDVTLSSVTAGAEIRYTLDGSTPDESSALYGGPIHLDGSTRVRARAFAEGFNASQFSEATYLVGQPPSSGDGLLATYWDNEDFTGASLTRVDPKIDFSFGSGSPDPAIDVDSFSARWTGKVIPRFTEDYTFYTSQDDGMRVWIDLDRSGSFEDETELIINDWSAGGTRERISAEVALEAGSLYDIRVEYWEANGNSTAKLLWSSFSEPKGVVPQSQLFSNAEFSQTVSTPVITPNEGTYTSAVNVTISTATPGATLYYTTDGSEPDSSSQVYTGEFTVAVTGTVRARAYKAGFNPSGVATSVFEIDAQPPVVQSFTWEGVEIANGETFVEAGNLAVTATDNQGITSAEFYYIPSGATTPILIGRDTHVPSGLTAKWSIAAVSDGAYQVMVRVYDTSGTFTEVSRLVNVALAVPAAPVITDPLTGVTVEDPVVPLRITSTPNANLRIFRDGVFVFSGYANASGLMVYSASLPPGTSVFHAQARNRAGNSPNSNAVSVARVREFPALALSFSANTVGEGVPVTGTVSLPVAESTDVSVQITTSIPNRMETVPPVVIPAGATSATFTLVGRVDSVIQLLPTLYVTASAAEHQDGLATLFLEDSPYPVISIELDETSVPESVGTVNGRVSRATAQNVPLRVYLTNSSPAKVQVPAYVTIPGGSKVTSFTATIVEDTVSDGNVTAQIGGEVRVGDTAVSTATSQSLEVRDDDGPVLSLLSPKPVLLEGSAVNFTLRRTGGDPASPLTVTLSQSGSGLSIPATASFAANVTQVNVPVNVPISPTSGTRQVTARASAVGYVDGLALVSVTDESLPDLVPANLSGPARVLTEQTFTVNYTIHNYGPVPIETPFLERVFLSVDSTPSSDDIIVRQVEQTATVAAEGSYGRNVSIFAPRDVGDYYLIVTADPGMSVAEISESNNTSVSVLPIQVRAAYSATVQTDTTVTPTNTPIVFYGSATKDGGAPAAFSMINIHIWTNGTERVISAVTNSLGAFSTTWNPLQNEGGVYTVGASHPGMPSAPEQDNFEILTMGFDPPGPIRLEEGETVVVNATVRNPNGRDLTGLEITLGDLPDGLTVTPQVSETTVPADDELSIPLSISAASGFSGSGRFPLTATTAEGVTMTVGLSVRADLLVPVLQIQPSSLQASVLRGGQQSVSFTVTNTGGLESGPVQVLLPDIPWIKLASSASLPSIPPGGSAGISLSLTPGPEIDLTLFSGNLAVNAVNGGSRTVPYRFRVVSDLTGDLQVKVVDELYYFTEEAPALAGAQVTLRDAISSAVIAQATTGADGTVTFNDVPEAWYRLEVGAEKHDRYSNNFFLMAGELSEELIFISKQLVNYTWTVEEVEIEDVYRITIETTFETNVPAPVVTVSPPKIDVDDLTALGQTKVVNLTFTNQGFIGANDSKLDFSEHPFYEFTPLVSNIGTIPAKSSLVVPVVVKRVGVFDESGNVVLLPSGAKTPKGAKLITKAGASVPCGAGGKLDYTYPCGPNNPSKSANIGVSGVQGNCSGSGGASGGYIGFHGGYFSGGGGGGPGGGGSASGGSGISFASADACDPCVQQAIVECLIGFTPVGCFYSTGKCVYQSGDAVFGNGSSGTAVSTCVEAIIGCATGDIPVIGQLINGFFCIKAVMGCGSGPGAGGGGGGSGGSGPGPKSRLTKNVTDGDLFFVIGSPWSEALTPEERSYASEIASPLSRMESILDYYAVIFGTRERTLVLNEEEGVLWAEQFFARVAAGSEGGLEITAEERADLETFASVLNSDQQTLLGRVIDRWNRTLDYAALGYIEVEDVPEGGSLDFIQDSRFKLAAQKLVESTDTSRELGYSDPIEEVGVAIRAFQQSILEGQGGVCSRVKIQISQDLVMTRTAFDATLVLENERDDVGVSDIGFDLQIRDLNGLPSQDLFNVQISQLTNLGAIDGTGSLETSSTGSVKWTLIPRDTAALTEEKQYTVGGVITYTQDGNEFTIPVENVPITVRPDASLTLKYFHQRDVFSDDPYTDAIEPAVPYKLAVMVENNGYGPARDLKIISGQPQIVENEKGLFINFKIIGTEVDGQPLTPSLTAEFGDLDPGQRSIATFLMTSTLQGLFIDYDATFEHVTGLGDPRISLLESVEIHEMIHTVYALDGGHDDGSPDFLVNDVPDVNDYPDTVHYSDGGSDLVTVKESGTFTGSLGGGNLSLTLDVGSFSGWTYIRVPDPAQGEYRLVSVVRQDGRVLPIDHNAWQTDRTFIGVGRRPIYEDILHLADSNSSGVYTLNYEPAGPADSVPPTSSMQALAANSPADIPVFWSGSDDQGVAYYDIYVSSNGGAFSLWRSKVSETSALYPGTPGETYAFYSIATDFSGNREVKTPAAESSTTALNSNVPPVIASIANQSVNERSVFSYQASAADPDGANSLLRWSLGSTVPGVTIDPLTGLIRWNTGESDGGRTVSLVVVATDAGTPPAVGNEAFTITVNDVNDAPVIGQVGPQTLQSGGVLVVDVDATDGDFPVQSLTYSLQNAPAGASIHPTSGVITWTAGTVTEDESHLFEVAVFDSGTPAKTSTMSFAVAVVAQEETDAPPVFASVPVVLWVKGSVYQLNVTAVDPDGDPVTLSASLTETPGAGFVDLGGGSGRFSWDTESVATGTYQVPLTASANGKSGGATLQIKIADDELYWNWVKDVFGELPEGFDLALLEMDADPDGDDRKNLDEMVFLTNPLGRDRIPVDFDLEQAPPFQIPTLRVHRRVGSEQYVDLFVRRGGLITPMHRVPATDFSASVDPEGDDDGRPESERIDFQIYEYFPGGIPSSRFYDVESAEKP